MNRPRPCRHVCMRIPLLPEAGARRAYGLVTLVNTFGFGLIVTSMVLYFTRVMHLSSDEVGLGMTIAGLVGLIAGVPIGDLADRYGPRVVVRATFLVSFLTTVGFLLVRDFAAFVAVATVDMLAMNANGAADGALLRRVGGEDGRDATVFRSATHALTNVGIALGAIGCAVAVEIGTPDAYRALIAGNALTFLGAWVVSGRLPKYPPLPAPDDGPRWGALTDRPFVAYCAHNALMSMQYFVMLTPLPLWIVTRTRAPGWTVGAVLLLNTFIVIAFQVRVGRNVSTIAQGGVAIRKAGLLFLVSCCAIGFTAGLPGWAALLLVAAAIAVHSIGELHHASGTFALDFGMAPEHAQGQYQGLAGLGLGAGATFAPILMLGLCLRFGEAGWLGLGVFFAVLGLTAPAIARWGASTRPSAAAAEPAAPVAAGPHVAEDAF
ncbi:MAG: Major Facilitator Superfamily protein [Actinomycetia bacterium]|nr:Major Facilitator Superfamily protein [Actinomycetes bacterium]